jgi:hypothetical protein
MIEFCKLIWCGLVGLFRSRASLEIEILALRHQLNILRRKSPKRPTFGSIDRVVFAGLYGLAPGVLSALAIVRPETVVRWHRAKVGLRARTLDHAGEASGAEGGAAFRCEHEGRLGFLFPPKPPQPPQFIPKDRMGTGGALLGPANMQGGRGEVYLIPAQVRCLGRPETVAIGGLLATGDRLP